MHGVSSPVDEFDQLLCKQIAWLESTFEWHKTSNKDELGDFENQSVRSDKENEISCWQKSFYDQYAIEFPVFAFGCLIERRHWKVTLSWSLEACLRFVSTKFDERLSRIFRLQSFLRVRTHTCGNFIASWIRTKFIGSPRHPSRISQLIPSRLWREHNSFSPFHLRVEMNKELWSTKHSKIKRNGEWNVLWLQHTPQIYFYHHKLEQQFVSAIGKKKKAFEVISQGWMFLMRCARPGHPIKKSFPTER